MFTIIAIQDGIVATMSHREPKAIDLSWGFQSRLPSGTCWRARRLRSTSRLSADRNSSVIFIAHPP